MVTRSNGSLGLRSRLMPLEQVPRLRKVASSFIKILKQFLRAVRKAREGREGVPDELNWEHFVLSHS